ncbi:hypothetical protein [Aeromonas media]|uniref:hypothetical protein n=1 Tax=Aeromonas media TaxID=651 RepID=UPI0038CFE067
MGLSASALTFNNSILTFNMSYFNLQHLYFDLQHVRRNRNPQKEKRMGNFDDFSDATEPVRAKPALRVATREELLAKGYRLSLDELNLPASPELDAIISVLQTRRGPVATAIWFQSANSWLGGPSPQSVLSTRMSDVMFAARREVDPNNGGHG